MIREDREEVWGKSRDRKYRRKKEGERDSEHWVLTERVRKRREEATDGE